MNKKGGLNMVLITILGISGPPRINQTEEDLVEHVTLKHYIIPIYKI